MASLDICPRAMNSIISAKKFHPIQFESNQAFNYRVYVYFDRANHKTFILYFIPQFCCDANKMKRYKTNIASKKYACCLKTDEQFNREFQFHVMPYQNHSEKPQSILSQNNLFFFACSPFVFQLPMRNPNEYSWKFSMAECKFHRAPSPIKQRNKSVGCEWKQFALNK